MGENATKVSLSLKLLVDSSTNKVLFAEAKKDFVDFLFHIMSLPVGTVVKLIGLKGMVGSLSDLHKSIASLDTEYMQENIRKDSVLNPNPSVGVPLLLLKSPNPSLTLYTCQGNHCYSPDHSKTCSSCSRTLCHSVTYLPSDKTMESSIAAKGYVKGGMTYMVMDNLEVKPMSTISSITRLNQLNVKDVGSLVEKDVQIGLNEGMAILKASLETKAVLSTVFLGESI